MSDTMFTKYKKSEEDAKVILMYLILNNYDLSKVQAIEEVVQEELFGLKFKRIYGVTSEYVDTKKIEAEIASTKSPVVCSPQSYEMYSSEKIIHAYRAKEQDKPLYINDMGIISPLMVITEDCIISSKIATSLEYADEKGFMYFVDYVLNGTCCIGNWEMTYKGKEFEIYYISDSNGEKRKERLYYAEELDQTSTYKLVLYVISKAVLQLEEFLPDNYESETWELR